jgi:hypothetical protein
VALSILRGITGIARLDRVSAPVRCLLVMGPRRLSAGAISLLRVVRIGILGHWYLTENLQSHHVTGLPARPRPTVDQASISTDDRLL